MKERINELIYWLNRLKDSEYLEAYFKHIDEPMERLKRRVKNVVGGYYDYEKHYSEVVERLSERSADNNK